MSSQYEYDTVPSVVRPDSAAVLVNLWRAPNRRRRREFTEALVAAVWPRELADGELSFALLDDDERVLLGYKQWTAKSAYDTLLAVRGFGGAAAFAAEHPDVEFWHGWFAVYSGEDAADRLHLGLRGDTGLCLAEEPGSWLVRPFDGVPLSGPTRFRLSRGIQRPVQAVGTGPVPAATR